MTKNLSLIFRVVVVVAIALNVLIYFGGFSLGDRDHMPLPHDGPKHEQQHQKPAATATGVAATGTHTVTGHSGVAAHHAPSQTAAPSLSYEEYAAKVLDEERKKFADQHAKSLAEVSKQHAEELEALKNKAQHLSDELKAQKEKEEAEQKEKERIKEEARKKLEENEVKKKEEDEKRKKEEDEKKKKEDEFKAPFWESIRAHLSREEEEINRTVVFPPEYVKNGPLEPSRGKIALLTAFDNGGSSANYKNVTEMSMQGREEYCNYHGYIHQFLNFTELKMADPTRKDASAVWLKMDAIKRTFELHPKVEWVWWVDTDLIIMDPKRDLAAHLLNPIVMEQRLTYGKPLLDEWGQITGLRYPERNEVDVDDIDMVISQDLLGLNAGSFFVRRSPFIDWLLDFWFDPVFIGKGFPRAEQGCLIHLMNHHPILLKHIGLVPQRMINAYHQWNPDDDPGFDQWHPNDFVIHFAGKNTNDGFLDLWDMYWDQRVLLPEDARTAPIKTTNTPRLTEEQKKIKEEQDQKAKEKLEEIRKKIAEGKAQEEEAKKKEGESEEKKEGESEEKKEDESEEEKEGGSEENKDGQSEEKPKEEEKAEEKSDNSEEKSEGQEAETKDGEEQKQQ